MADINVERKSPSVWPWVIGLIVLALIIWALAELFGGDADNPADEVSDTTVIEAPAEMPAASPMPDGGVPVPEPSQP